MTDSRGSTPERRTSIETVVVWQGSDMAEDYVQGVPSGHLMLLRRVWAQTPLGAGFEALIPYGRPSFTSATAQSMPPTTGRQCPRTVTVVPPVSL